MSEDCAKETRIGQITLIFIYAAVFHILILRYEARTVYSPPADRTFIDHPLVNFFFPCIGAIFLTIFIVLLRRMSGPSVHGSYLKIIAICGVSGVIATTLAFETFFVLLGLYLNIFARSDIPGAHSFMGWEIWMLNIQTYGMVPMLRYSPIEFLNGLGIGVWLVATRAEPVTRNC